MKLQALAVAGILAFTGVVASAAPATAATNPCDGSGFPFYKSGENNLTNGQLLAQVCSSSSTAKVGRVRTSYKKTAGSGVTVQFGWEFVNSNATVNGGSWWTGSNTTIAAGQTKGYNFNYPSGLSRPTGAKCIRGKMKDMIGGSIWYTRVIC